MSRLACPETHRWSGRLAAASASLLAVVVMGCDVGDSPVGVPSASTFGFAPMRAAATSHSVISDRYIVTFRDSVQDSRDVAAALAKHAGGTLHFSYRSIKGFSATLPPQAIDGLRHNPRIAAIEPDQTISTADVQTPAPWSLDRIDQRVLPLNASYGYRSDGAGTNVYIVDTGIRTTHTMLGGRAVGAFTAVEDGNGTSDCHGHGTHVAGIVGSTTYGVAKRARLYGVRVLDCAGQAPNSAVIAGLDWIIENHVPPAVANLVAQRRFFRRTERSRRTDRSRGRDGGHCRREQLVGRLVVSRREALRKHSLWRRLRMSTSGRATPIGARVSTCLHRAIASCRRGLATMIRSGS